MARALLIAEKPSLMQTILTVYKKIQGSYPDTIDFTCFAGHVIALKEPRDYNNELWQSKKWSFDMLPIMPENFEYKVPDGKYTRNGKEQYNSKNDKRKMYKDLVTKLKSANYDYIINACDADREGNHIFHLFYMYSGCKLPIKRFWSNDLTDKSVEYALRNLRTANDGLKPNLTNLTNAAVLRAHLDWLVGMNFTIASSVELKQTIRVGRVKSAALTMLGMREDELANFVPKTTYGLTSLYKEGFSGNYFNENGEVIVDNKNDFDTIMKSLGKTAIVESMESKVEKTYAPSLFNMAALQNEAGNTFGYDANETLGLAQTLYEKKLISYPRADCPYLSSEMVKNFDHMLNAVAILPEFKPYVDKITKEDKARVAKSKDYINDAELQKASHYAIVPTGDTSNINDKDLTEKHKNVLNIIFKKFLSIFMPPTINNKTVLITNNNGYKFKTNGKMLVDKGYAILYDTNFKDVDLPKLNKGDVVNVDKIEVKEKVSKPPKRYTDAEFVLVMEKPGKFLEDETLKEILKDKKGIGTEATRGGIIDELETNGYIEKKKGRGKAKAIFVTELGMFIYRNIKNKDYGKVDMTAIWETKLSEIEQGSRSVDDFEKEMKQYILDGIEDIKSGNYEVKDFEKTTSTIGVCPKCKKRNVKVTNKFYCCEGYKDECDFIFGKQIYGAKISETEAKKIVSGKVTKEFDMRKDDKSWKAALVYKPQEGRVGFADREVDLGICPACKTGHIKNGKDYYLCENYPNSCKFIVAKNMYGAKISIDDIKLIINGERTKSYKMSKGEKSWETSLMYLEDTKQVGFAPKEEPKELGKCPCCGGSVKETKNGYICENYKNPCLFYVAKDMYGAKITTMELKKILYGKETKEYSMEKDGKKWVAKLVYNPETKRVEFAKKKK